MSEHGESTDRSSRIERLRETSTWEATNFALGYITGIITAVLWL